MNKRVFTCLIIIILILGGIYYKSNSIIFKTKIKINEAKVKQILYIYEIENNKMATFDMTNNLKEKDISSIVGSLNNGVLIPDKNQTGTYTLEHIEMLVLGERWLYIYKQKDCRFTVKYSTNPGSNDINDDKQTTIDSEVLQSYFMKFSELSKSLTPSETWDINKN